VLRVHSSVRGVHSKVSRREATPLHVLPGLHGVLPFSRRPW